MKKELDWCDNCPVYKNEIPKLFLGCCKAGKNYCINKIKCKHKCQNNEYGDS